MFQVHKTQDYKYNSLHCTQGQSPEFLSGNSQHTSAQELNHHNRGGQNGTSVHFHWI